MLSIIYLSSAQREKELTRKNTEINDMCVHGKWEIYPLPTSQSIDHTTNMRLA